MNVYQWSLMELSITGFGLVNGIGTNLHLYLIRNGRKYIIRGSLVTGRDFIKNLINIDKRPNIVESKIKVSDLEIGNIIGRNH